ncbi:MAG: LLM class flavin-dependent oxidoreductase, partial [Nitrososphaerota archaeon]
VSDHFFNREVFITLAEIAHRTRRVRLGPAVVNPYIHHPVIIAQSIATLYEIAGGRVRLAVGAGDNTSLGRLGIVREKPVEKVGECVRLIRALTAGGDAGGVRLDIPLAEPPSIFVGAQSGRMLELAAKIADGVLVNWSNLDMLKESSKRVRGSGRDWRSFTLGAHLIVSIHDDPAKARKTAIPFASYLMVGASTAHLERLGISEEYRKEVISCLTASDWERLYTISGGEWVDYFSVWGNPGKLEEHVVSLIELGYGEIVFGGPLGPRPYTALRTISHIIRRLRREMEDDRRIGS